MSALESVESIIQTIEQAFSGVRRGAITLHEAEVLDSYGTDAERQDARTLDTEDDWRQVPDASIGECPVALSFVDPKSWRFYLPAYMRFGLRFLTAPSKGAIDHAIYSLDMGDNPTLADYKLERFRTLNVEQARAVQQFLAIASENENFCDGRVARNALAAYWSNAAGA
jgi:hypothetical protein